MSYTLDQLIRDGYRIPPAPPGDWRTYDERNPVPGYFDFDWLSARHPDLYDAFALSSTGLMDELEKLVDLSGLEVIDVGAGTGRSALGAARRAKHVTAVDAFESVACFGSRQARRAGMRNVHYARGHRDHLPFAPDTFDALVNSWAELNEQEAYRVLKPGGLLIRLDAPLEALCGELTAVLKDVFPQLIHEVAPEAWYRPDCPPEDTHFDAPVWHDLPVIPPVKRHDFTYRSEYSDDREAAAMLGRLYGPQARQYLLDRRQSHFTERLRIEIARVRK